MESDRIVFAGQGTERTLFSAAQCREMDRVAIEEHGIPGFDLMSRAGQRAFDILVRELGSPQQLVVLCGPGNNGGDGYVVADLARTVGIDVKLVETARPGSDDAGQARARFVENGGVSVALESIRSVTPGTVIVDALLGTGLRSDPRDQIARAIEWINCNPAPVLAIDVPSGLNCDTGVAYEPCVRADLTVTFIADKCGLHTGSGVETCGRIFMEGLAVPAEIIHSEHPVAAVIGQPQLPTRALNSHKGRYGHVVIAGGQPGMLGAVLLAGTAALRTGSGLVTLLTDDDHVSLAAIHRPELMGAGVSGPGIPGLLSDSADCVIVGPGMGQGDLANKLTEVVSGFQGPLVVDADGLNFLARSPDKADNRILTPHPGEAARLLETDTGAVQSDRFGAVREIVGTYGGVAVLKGAGTLVSDGRQTWLCDRGNPGMAVGGMGDALSGIIGSLVGQGFPLVDAARAGVWLHAAAADQAVLRTGEAGLLPTDVIDELPGLLSATI